MTATFDRVQPEQVYATDEQVRQAVRQALTSSGHTYDELAALARTGDFDSMRSRVAWVAVRDLQQFID